MPISSSRLLSVFSLVGLQNQPARRRVSISFGSHTAPLGSPSLAVATPERAASAETAFQLGSGAKPSSLPTQRMVADLLWNTIAFGTYRFRMSLTSNTRLPSHHNSEISP